MHDGGRITGRETMRRHGRRTPKYCERASIMDLLLSWLRTAESWVLTLATRTATDQRIVLHEDVEVTAEELQQRHAAVTACRESLRAACGGLLDLEERVAALEDGVRVAILGGDSASALRQAVELEKARAALAAARVRVTDLQRACLNHQGELSR